MILKSLSAGRTSPIFGRIVSVSAGAGRPFFTITSISPTSVLVGAPDTVVSIFGGVFNGTSVPYINGVPAAVYSLITPGQINVTIPAATLATTGLIVIRVRDSVTPTTKFSNAALFAVAYPVPTLTNHSPANVNVSAVGATLTLTGTGFFSGGTTATVNGIVVPLGYLSPTSGTIVIPLSVMADAGAYLITVVNPAPGGGTSASRTVNVRYPLPVFTLMPTNVPVDSGDTPVTLNDASNRFYDPTAWVDGGTKAFIDAVEVPIVFVNAGQVGIYVPAAVTAVPGTKAITASNPTAGGGGGTSAPVNFTVAAASGAPVLSSISPTTQNQYRSNFELTCTGTGFTATSIVNQDGVPLTTFFDTATQVRATVPKATNLISAAKSITVSDTSGTSAAQILAITAWTPASIPGVTGRFRVRAGNMVENPPGFIQTLTNLANPGVGNATQATAGSRPELVAADATFNNKPSIRKNAGTSQLLVGAGFNTYVTDVSKLVLAVGTVDVVAASGNLFVGVPGGTFGFHMASTTLASYRFRAYDGSFDETAPVPPIASAIPLGTAQRMKGTHGGGNIQLDVNGVVSALVASGPSSAPQMASAFQIFISTAAGYTQRVCEVVLGNLAITAPDEDCWKNYVENEYGIPA